MKSLYKNFKWKIALSMLMVGFATASCEDYLEVIPKDSLSDAILWADEENAELVLNGLYGKINLPLVSLGSGTNPWFDCADNYTDNSINHKSWAPSRGIYTKGLETPLQVSALSLQWPRFGTIRACNLFISRVEASTLDGDWKKQKLAEARFLRAFQYSILWTMFGGVPIITDVLDRNTQGDEIFRARNTDDETYQFIVDECAAIADDLPLVPETARVGKGTALTLKAWCELFHASPLKNPGNDKSRWALAAATNKQVMDLGVYSLFPNHETMLYEANNNNKEIIFSRTFLGNTAIGNSRSGLQSISKVNGIQYSWGGVQPLQELVDSYAMANGLPITNPESGYDPQNPYANREKRFYDDILYDGCIWQGFEVQYWIGSGSQNELDLFFGGTIRPASSYHTRKGIESKYYINGDNKLSSANFAIFRYAEVLLSYAEAQNEATGPDESVYNTVNQVRARVDLPPLKANLSQDEMRTAIRRERRVELCFEDKRWFDIIRWKIAENVIPSCHTMKITKQNGKKVYTVVSTGGTRIFHPDRQYLIPIQIGTIDLNEKLVQNPGYGNN